MKAAVLATVVLVLAHAVAPRAAAQVRGDTTGTRDPVTVLEPVRVDAPRIAGDQATAPHARSARLAADLPRGTPALALDDVLRAIPGVQVDNRFNYALGERISIRGAGARAQFGVRGVRVLVDGIPATLPDGQTSLNLVDLTTISRVEVLRGPVASLYGNAAGGAILVETEPPPRAPFGAAATVAGGSHGLLRTRAAAGGTQGQLAWTASLSRVAYDGYRTHGDAENLYGSARVLWMGERDLVRVAFNAVDYDALNPGSLSDSLLRVDRSAAFRNNVAQRTGESGAQQQGGVQWRHHFGAHELELSGWGIARDLTNPIPARVIVVDRRAGGARLIHRGSLASLAWTAGIEHERQRDDRQNYVNESGSPAALVLDQLERVRGLGTFVQANVTLVPRVSVLGALRHDRTTFHATDRLVSDTDPDDSGSRGMSAVSPSAGVTLELPRAVMLYTNVGTSFETPTTTELANRPDAAGGFNPMLEPQRTISWEVGARRETTGMAAQLAVYRALVRDALIPFEVPDVPGRQFFRNAGRTATAGVEAGVSLEPLRQLRIDAAYTFTDARFRDYVVGEASFERKRVPGIAPHRSEVTTTWRTPRGWAAIDLRHQARLPVDDANGAWSRAYALADLRAGVDGIEAGRTRFSLFAGVQNLLATEYNASVVVNAFGRRYYEPGPARTFHLGGSVSAR